MLTSSQIGAEYGKQKASRFSGFAHFEYRDLPETQRMAVRRLKQWSHELAIHDEDIHRSLPSLLGVTFRPGPH